MTGVHPRFELLYEDGTCSSEWVPGYGEDRMTQQWPAEENQPDFDKLAEEQRTKYEPDELDGPAADLDRTLDDEDPDSNS